MNRIPRVLVGRFAALLTALGALASLLAEQLEHGGVDDSDILSSAVAVGAGVGLFFLPWNRFNNVGTLAFMWLSLFALFMGTVTTESDHMHPEYIPIYLLVLFAWNGLAHRRGSSLKFAPVAFAVMFMPEVIGRPAGISPFLIGLTIPMSVFVGELVAWVSTQLVTAEEERRIASIKADLITSASHELRTPLSSVLGYARLIEARSEHLSMEDIKDFCSRIVNNAKRLEGIVSRLIDVEKANDKDDSVHEGDMGLLDTHFRGDGPTKPQPETLTGD